MSPGHWGALSCRRHLPPPLFPPLMHVPFAHLSSSKLPVVGLARRSEHHHCPILSDPAGSSARSLGSPLSCRGPERPSCMTSSLVFFPPSYVCSSPHSPSFSLFQNQDGLSTLSHTLSPSFLAQLPPEAPLSHCGAQTGERGQSCHLPCLWLSGSGSKNSCQSLWLGGRIPFGRSLVLTHKLPSKCYSNQQENNEMCPVEKENRTWKGPP